MASAEWEEMWESCHLAIKGKLEEGEATPWALLATDNSGTTYLIELNNANPYYVLKLMVDTIIHLREWVQRHPQRQTTIPLDPEGGPKE